MTELADAFGGGFAQVAGLRWMARQHATAEGLRDRRRRGMMLGCIDRLCATAGDLEWRTGSWHGDWTPWNMARSWPASTPVGLGAVRDRRPDRPGPVPLPGQRDHPAPRHVRRDDPGRVGRGRGDTGHAGLPSTLSGHSICWPWPAATCPWRRGRADLT